jgi:hypothetical protein
VANGIDWFRWHHGSVNDPKFGLVAKKAGARVGDVITVWALVLEQASANVERGVCGDIDCEATDFLLGADDGTTARILEAMRARGLITDDRVTRWEDRQPKRERVDTTAADRKRAQRERERDNAPSGDVEAVTPSHATSHQVTPREEKSREEVKEPPKPPVGGLTVVTKPEGKTRTRGVTLKTFLADCKANDIRPMRDYEPLWNYTRNAKLPDDFVALAWVEFCRRFGAGGVKESNLQKDWRKTFRNYVENNYLKLWAVSTDGEYYLTAQGKQAQTVAEAA